MSKRSPFWRAFSISTPLGYRVAGFFNTEPGYHYGSLRITHVDGELPRSYVLPGIPEMAQAQPSLQGLSIAHGGTVVDLRAVERLDGTLIAFYPLFDGDGALVEVLARTRDTVIVADTPWRRLAELTAQARHAGIEEAVRRQRGVFVFQLVGSANPRLVGYPFELKFVLQQVLRGTGRTLATFSQLRGWSNQYGLDLPVTLAQFDPQLDSLTLAREVLELEQSQIPPTLLMPGQMPTSGLVLWQSERASATILDLPARVTGETALVGSIEVWDTMARLADRGAVPGRDIVVAALAARRSAEELATLNATLPGMWERWARAYPHAFAVESVRVAV